MAFSPEERAEIKRLNAASAELPAYLRLRPPIPPPLDSASNSLNATSNALNTLEQAGDKRKQAAETKEEWISNRVGDYTSDSIDDEVL